MADLSITATNVRGFGERIDGTLGGTVTAGQPVRRQLDGSFISSTDASLAGSQVDGIALSGGAANQPFAYQRGGLVDLGATLSIGMTYVLSTSGAIAPISDVATNDWRTDLGIATAANRLKMGINVSGVQAASDVT
jgi:hypothetical protein